MKRSLLSSLAALICLAIVAAVCFQTLTRHPGDILVGAHDGGQNDVTAQIMAFRGYQRICLERFGQLPLWNPYSLGGMPWLGNPQSSLFYPPNWLFLLVPSQTIVSWLLAGHHLLAGLGAYFLSRHYGFRWTSSLLAGVIFLAAPYYVANTAEGHYNPVCLVAWMPWQFLAFERLRQGRPGGVFLCAGLLALCFFCGHVQELFYLVLIQSGFIAADVLGKNRDSLAIARGTLLRNWLLVCLGVAGLVAVELIPTWIYTRHAVRVAGLSAAQASQISLGPSSLRQLFNPFALGGPDAYAGPGGFYWETLCYFGLAPLVLALIGVVTRYRTYPVARLAVLWLLALLFAFGDDTPVFSIMYSVVPGVSYFRAPSRALFFCSFAVAILAAAGLDAILATIAKGRLARSQHRVKLGLGLAAAVAVVVCAAELAVHATRVLHSIPRASLRRGSPLCEFLAENAGHDRVMIGQRLLSDREAWAAGVQKVQGYDPVPLGRIGLFAAAYSPRRDPALQLSGFDPIAVSSYHKPLVDLLGVRYAVTTDRSAQHVDGWQVVQQGRLTAEFALRGQAPPRMPYVVYENQSAMPRAFVVGQAAVQDAAVDPIQQLRRLDPRQEVLLADDVLPPGNRETFRPARIVEYTPKRVTVEAELAAPGYLVLTDIWYPGWTASVNGQAAPLLAANVAFRAVPLPQGKHSIVLAYRTFAADLGLMLTVMTIMLLATSSLAGRSRWLAAFVRQQEEPDESATGDPRPALPV